MMWREEKKARAKAAAAKPQKSLETRNANLEYVGTEVESEHKPMSAKQDGDVEYAARVPLPVQVAAVRPPVSAALYNEIHAIVNYCKKAESKEPGIIHFEGYRHLVQMLKQLENRVQIILPGMEAMFAADDKPKARCTSSEAESYCSSIGLPADDGTWFFDKMQGCGWKNGGESVKDCFATIRAWKRAGYMASQKRAQSNGHSSPEKVSAYTLKTQLDAIETKIKRIRHRGTEGPFGLSLDEDDKPEYRSLCDKKKELVNKIAALT
jgi:hypothetical protein